MPERRPLRSLRAGQVIVAGSYEVVVDEALAEAFADGDRLIVLGETGDVLHVPAADGAAAGSAVDAAVQAFAALTAVDDDAITTLFERCADRVADPAVVAELDRANAADVASAEQRGRSTTRLVLGAGMRASMVDGLRGWASSPLRRDGVIERIEHDGWHLDVCRAPLGVVGFVFEGRPNVFADALGVVRTGNTVVMRIGGDALGTARAMMASVIAPSLADAGLPPGTVSLVDAVGHAGAWALFDDRRLSLAVARGSGPAVGQLGAIARQAGIAASLHGTGGAWMVVSEHADPDRLVASLAHSLDRKVCNTVNVVCLTAAAVAAGLGDAVVAAIERAGAAAGAPARLHVTAAASNLVPRDWFERVVTIERPDGPRQEPVADEIEPARLAEEWEWERSPELSVAVAADLDEAVELVNTHSPRFVVSVLSSDPDDVERVYAGVDAPFVGDGFTRWVDGQYALETPELGLSNWQHGRLLGRPAILSGASMFTTRYRAAVTDPDTHR